MRKYVFIAAGGAVGALLRHWLTAPGVDSLWAPIPAGTLIANLAGCFALAFFLTVTLEVFRISPPLRLGIATGGLGAFTTFSGVCREVADLIASGLMAAAALYIVLTLVCGFGAAYLGIILAREVERRKLKTARTLPGEEEAE